MQIPKLRKNGDGRAFSVLPNWNGKRFYFGKYGTAKAQRAYQQWLSRYFVGDSFETDNEEDHFSIQSLCDVYYQWHESEWPERETERSLVKHTSQHLCQFAGGLPADEMGPKLLILFLDRVSAESYQKHSQTRMYSRTYVNKMLACIKRIVKWGCSRELIPADLYSRLLPVEGVRRGKARDTQPVSAVPIDDILKTLPFLPERVAAMCQIQYLCGMRPGEVCGMKWEWISIPQGEGVWVYTPTDHKNEHRGKHLVKAIPQAAQRILRPLQDASQSPFVFSSDCGRFSYRVDSYRNAVIRGVQKAERKGIEICRWTPGQLRHSIATDIRKMMGQEQAQLYLGHSRLDTTAIYAERSTEAVANLASHLDQTLFTRFAV